MESYFPLCVFWLGLVEFGVRRVVASFFGDQGYMISV